MTVSVTELKHDEFFRDFVGHGLSLEGPQAALSDSLAMALGPLIGNGKG